MNKISSLWNVITAVVTLFCIASYLVAGEKSAEESAPPAGGIRSPALRVGMELDISVTVTGKLEIDEKAKRIDSDGMLNVPLLGPIHVTGMTVRQLRTRLYVLYERDYFVNPRVSVEFSNKSLDTVAPWGYVTVLGEVKAPGRVNIPSTLDMTVSQAIQQAGGGTDMAKLSDIKVTRPTTDGENKTIRVNLKDVGARGEIADDIRVRSGDVVFVPEIFL